MTTYHNFDLPSESDFPLDKGAVTYENKDEMIDDLLCTTEIWGRVLQLDAEYRSLRDNYEILNDQLEHKEGNPEDVLEPEDAELDEIYQTARYGVADYNPLETGQTTEEMIDDLEDTWNHFTGQFLGSDGLEWEPMVEYINEIKERGVYERDRNGLYEEVSIANKLNNAVSEAIRREGGSPETPNQPNSEVFKEYLAESAEILEDGIETLEDKIERQEERKEEIERRSNNDEIRDILDELNN